MLRKLLLTPLLIRLLLIPHREQAEAGEAEVEVTLSHVEGSEGAALRGNGEVQEGSEGQRGREEDGEEQQLRQQEPGLNHHHHHQRHPQSLLSHHHHPRGGLYQLSEKRQGLKRRAGKILLLTHRTVSS